jgi:hypothetical protein
MGWQALGMTDTPNPSAKTADVLDAAVAKVAQPAPRFQMVHVNMPNLLHTLLLAAMPAGKHLDEAIKLVAHTRPADEAVAAVGHYDVIRQWCAANPDEAAHVVLCAVYMANGRFVAQEELQPPEPAAPPAADAAPAPAAAPAAEIAAGG